MIEILPICGGLTLSSDFYDFLNNLEGTIQTPKLEKENRNMKTKREKKVSVKKVIYNEPAVIVIWSDGTKTKAVCGAEDQFNKEAGLAICFAKKWIGNKAFHNAVEKYADE